MKRNTMAGRGNSWPVLSKIQQAFLGCRTPLGRGGGCRGETTRVDDMFKGLDIWPRVPESI